MKRIIVFLVSVFAIFVCNQAAAIQAEVIRSQPIERNYYERVPLDDVIEVCETNYVARGWIEDSSRRVFGSSTGALGSAIGIAIGDKIGDGRGRYGAMAVGAILGNKIGNDINDKVENATKNCELRPSGRTTVVTTTVVEGYKIRVRLNDGSRYTVTRPIMYQPGEIIDVQIMGVQ